MRWFVLSIAILASAAALAMHFAKIEWPDKLFWAEHTRVLLTCALISATAPWLQSFAVENNEKKRRKALELEKSIKEFLTAALVDISRAMATDCTKAGLHAFLVKRPFPWTEEVQVRIARVKLSFNPPPSGITWTKGKGVIGRCWTLRGNHVRNLEGWFAPHLAVTEQQWNGLPADTTYGLSFVEFTRTKEHFGTVAAVPILAGGGTGKYKGCVSFDLPAGGPTLNEGDLTDRLRVCAHSIEVFLAG